MNKYEHGRRKYGQPEEEQDLGPLSLLPGKWRGNGTGWNMIALPFKDGPFGFRVLMNQYDEQLEFDKVDDNVPNRGLPGIIDDSSQFDQFVVTLDYQQQVQQVIAEDFPDSGLAGAAGLPIHHEPGLFLYMKNLRTRRHDIGAGPDATVEIARLASIPHGNSVLALGMSEVVRGAPKIPPIRGLPLGRFGSVDSDRYLEPYKHYIDNPFMGTVVGVPGFPGFHPNDMNAILRFANEPLKDEIERTTILTLDTKREAAGIANIPFIEKQADAVSMKSTFWIQELKDPGKGNGYGKGKGKGRGKAKGKPRLRMQYSQVVMLDFFQPRQDELPGRAQWPHISINTLGKGR